MRSEIKILKEILMNKKYIISLLLVAFSVLLSQSVIAQDSSHELSVYGGPGLGMLKAKTSNGVDNKSDGIGGIFGVGYTYHFTSGFALQTGLEYSTYNVKLSASALDGRYITFDNDVINEEFEYRYSLNGYNEKLKAGYLQIPIMLQCQMAIDDSKSFYISAGMKFGFAVTKSFESSLATLTTEGYYPDTEVIIAEDLPYLGFGKFENLSSDGDFELKTAYIAALETGMKWGLTEKMSLYTGVYFDYGLNNVNKTSGKSLVEYNSISPSTPTLNSVASSALSDSRYSVDKLNLMTLGVKVKLSFDL